jgi:hypothetical protein
MKPENEQILKDNEHHWLTLKNAKYLKGMNQGEKDSLLKVMREEFEPKCLVDMWCGHCVAAFVKKLYGYYEKWKQDQAAQPQVVHATFPKQDKGYTVIKVPSPEISAMLFALLDLQALTGNNLIIVEPVLAELSKMAGLNFMISTEFEKVLTVVKVDIDVVLDVNFESDISKVKLKIKPEKIPDVDYAIIGTGRWNHWQQLADQVKTKKFASLGDQEAIAGSNCVNIQGQSLNVLCNVLMSSQACLYDGDSYIAILARILSKKVIHVKETDTLVKIKNLIK